jgi:isopentenyl diphosphate isomerase/L-lactate dehydrogenase-like FMN-dependent dehydrogenase
VFDSIAGGAGAELTLRANRSAFEAIRAVPRVLTGFDTADTTTTVLGRRLSMPLYIAPMSAHGLIHPAAESATAGAAARAGVAFGASTHSTRSLEEIAAVGAGVRWFQLYIRTDPGRDRDLLERAEAAGYGAVLLTVDQALLGLRERDIRNGWLFPFEGLGNFASIEEAEAGRGDLGWADVDRVRAATSLPVFLKGILHADDAEEAVQRGADGIVVSNHGGRSLDSGIGTVAALPAIAERVAGRIPILLDGGVRRGLDVFKALALGAVAVGIGRPALWALALAGEEGVTALLDRFHEGLVNTMVLAGAATIGDIRRDSVLV